MPSTLWIPTGKDTHCEGFVCPPKTHCWRPKLYDLPQLCVPEALNINGDLRKGSTLMPLEEDFEDWEKWTLLVLIALLALSMLMLAVTYCACATAERCCAKKNTADGPLQQEMPMIDMYGFRAETV